MNYLPLLQELYRHIQAEKGTVKCMKMNEKAIVRADDMKRPIPLYDFKAFGEAIKSPERKGRAPQQGQQRPLYLPALPSYTDISIYFVAFRKCGVRLKPYPIWYAHQ